MPLISFFRNDFKDFSLQNRLHFRVHAVQMEIKAKNTSKVKKSSSSMTFKGAGQTKDDLLPMGNGSAAENYQELTEEQAKKILQGR